MTIDKARLSVLMRAHRTQIVVGSASVVAFVGFIGLGIAARRRAAAASVEITQLASIRSEVSNFRLAFRASPADDARLLSADDTTAVSTTHDLRVSLAEQIASLAEHAGLASVRVRFTQPDSAAAPPRPDLMRSSVTVANYTLTVDAAGRLGDVLSLVNQLPSSVALQRLTATRAKNGAEYHLVLAVLESAGVEQHG